VDPGIVCPGQAPRCGPAPQRGFTPDPRAIARTATPTRSGVVSGTGRVVPTCAARRAGNTPTAADCLPRPWA
jgi:hypothetical protein